MRRDYSREGAKRCASKRSPVQSVLFTAMYGQEAWETCAWPIHFVIAGCAHCLRVPMAGRSTRGDHHNRAVCGEGQWARQKKRAHPLSKKGGNDVHPGLSQFSPTPATRPHPSPPLTSLLSSWQLARCGKARRASIEMGKHANLASRSRELLLLLLLPPDTGAPRRRSSVVGARRASAINLLLGNLRCWGDPGGPRSISSYIHKARSEPQQVYRRCL